MGLVGLVDHQVRTPQRTSCPSPFPQLPHSRSPRRLSPRQWQGRPNTPLLEKQHVICAGSRPCRVEQAIGQMADATPFSVAPVH